MVKIVKSNLLPPQFNRQFQPQFQKRRKKKKDTHTSLLYINSVVAQAKHSTGLSFGRPCAARRIRHYVEESEPRAGRAQSMQPYLTQFQAEPSTSGSHCAEAARSKHKPCPFFFAPATLGASHHTHIKSTFAVHSES